MSTPSGRLKSGFQHVAKIALSHETENMIWPDLRPFCILHLHMSNC